VEMVFGSVHRNDRDCVIAAGFLDGLLDVGGERRA
jgi:hypothetical protein